MLFRSLPAEERARTFQAKPVWQRAIVVAAGPVVNFVLAVLILAVLLRERQKLPAFLIQAGPPVVLLNGLGIGAAALVSHLGRLPRPQRVALAVVVNLQNAVLAIGITAGLLGDPTMAVPPALYGLWMYFSALLLVVAGRHAAARGAATAR